jgi:hypothetical protein
MRSISILIADGTVQSTEHNHWHYRQNKGRFKNNLHRISFYTLHNNCDKITALMNILAFPLVSISMNMQMVILQTFLKGESHEICELWFLIKSLPCVIHNLKYLSNQRRMRRNR